MSLFSMISSGIGGLGLFLLGMWLMSDGLKMAAGGSLTHFLHHWTKTRLRGLGIGILLTALIQSSGAVTVATIGFANAGLLSLKRAIWIIFGSNIGTTATGWLITLIGFNFKISVFALPMIGVGMVIKLVKSDSRIGAFGQALVGFGILFMGIDVLKDTFSLLGTSISLSSNGESGIQDLVLFVGFGFLITVLTQSSSVTLALTLTALAGGLISLLPAASLVIGGNLGTTTTAIFASFGTSPVAKRVVASHVIFNVVTAIVSFTLLSSLLSFILLSQGLFTTNPSTTTTLALFHTLFNVLGVILMWPITKRLVKWLSHRFKTKEEDEGKPQFLNKNTLSLPSLALHALSREIVRVGHYSLAMAKDSINLEHSTHKMTNKNIVVKKLTIAIGDYTKELYTQNLSEKISEKLPIILRVSQYYDAISELSLIINSSKKQLSTTINADIQDQINEFYKLSIHLLEQSEIGKGKNNSHKIETELSLYEIKYQSLKSLLLRRGAEGTLSIAKMDKIMNSTSQIRRINQQAVKALIHFKSLDLNFENLNDDDA